MPVNLAKLDAQISNKLLIINQKNLLKNSWSITVSWLLAHFGDAIITFPILLLIIALFKNELRDFGIFSIINVLVAVTIVLLIKLFIKRTRPQLSLPGFKYSMMNKADKFSFPSGHAARTFAIATTYNYYFSNYAWLVFSIAALVGLARVSLGVHYLGDVIVGWIIGIGSTLLLLGLLK
jgi:undecaprenyl-diphosphatase